MKTATIVLMVIGVICMKGFGSQKDVAAPENRSSTLIDLSSSEVLNKFGGVRLNHLEQYLASDASWHVRHWNGRKVAFKRTWSGQGWESSMNMYFQDYPRRIPRSGYTAIVKDLQYRVGIYLDGDTPPVRGIMGVPTIRPENQAQASSGEMDIALEKSNLITNKFESRLWISGDGIGLEIFEQTPKEDRIHTRRFLEEVCSELGKLKNLKTETELNKLLANDSFLQQEETIFEIEGLRPKGRYEATGYVNPGEEGLIYVKAFEKSSGKQLSKEETEEKVEYPGWSEDSLSKFYYRFNFMIFEGDWSKQYQAHFELWFKPENGGPERKLANTEKWIYGWQR